MDKMKDKAQAAKGEAKQKAGDATDNEQWQAEGKADQVKGNLLAGKFDKSVRPRGRTG